MKTDIDIKDELFGIIKDSELMRTVNGVLRKTKRPKNSEKEDVVISILANPNGQLQESAVNVNVYLLADEVDEGGGVQYEEPTIRAREICEICNNLFKVINMGSYRVTLDTQRVIEIPDTKFYVVNNLLSYSTVNE